MKKISSYQIYNVLKAYSRQLIRTKILASKGKEIQTERSKITGGKGQAVIEQISIDIIDKIKYLKSICEDPGKEKKRAERHLNETKLIYYTIDENNQKIIHIVTVEDSDSGK